MKPERKRDEEKGVVMVLFACALTATLLALGLAIDLGVAYVASSAMSKSVDAGVLAAARYSSGTPREIEELAVQIAEANFPDNFIPVHYKATVTIPGIDTLRVRIDANSQSPALFSRIIGKEQLKVRSTAEATRYPLDMSFVLDISYSLEMNNVFDDMQVASKQFISFFDEQVDRVGLVAYSNAAKEHRAIAKYFSASISNAIDGLTAIRYTNIDDGLLFGAKQFENANPRENAIKVLVLFTDGRPTAFTDDLYMDLRSPMPTWYEGVITTGSSGGSVGGLYRPTDGRKILYFDTSTGSPVTGSPTSNSSSTHLPRELPGGLALTDDNVRALGIAQAEAQAAALRAAGVTIYCVGLGNRRARAQDQPDLDFLRRLANVDGIVSSTQTRGEMMFAPSAAELEEAFAAIADRILIRLTR